MVKIFVIMKVVKRKTVILAIITLQIMTNNHINCKTLIALKLIFILNHQKTVNQRKLKSLARKTSYLIIKLLIKTINYVMIFETLYV